MKLGGNWIGLMSERRKGDTEGFVKNDWFQTKYLNKSRPFIFKRGTYSLAQKAGVAVDQRRCLLSLNQLSAE
jgi:hypothetical protein